MSTPSQSEEFRIEIIPDLTPHSPRSTELAELYLHEMGNLDEYNPELVAEELKSDRMKGATFVAMIDGNENIVAMGGLIQPLGSSEGMVTNVATASEHQRKGLATIVLGEIARLAVREDLTHLSVIPSPRSSEFYEQLGFDATKTAPLRIKKL